VKLDPAAIAAGRAGRTTESAARATDIAPIIDDLKGKGAVSLRQIAASLNERGIPTARGRFWSAVQVQRVMNRAGAM
jgi:Recombinase